MSGHSKWANIKHQKNLNDQARGAAFTRLSRMITMAVIEGGKVTDPAHNVRLRLAIEKAHEHNMPKDNINRAIEKASSSDAASLQQVRYEAFANHGISLIILAATDNVNRTTAQVRNVLERFGGKLGVSGSASRLFQECGVVVLPKSTHTQDIAFQCAQDLEAYDMEEDDDHYIIYIPFMHLGHIKDQDGAIHPSRKEYYMRPVATIAVDPVQAEAIHTIVGALEELDDVSQVFTNASQ